jgi:transcriptional regulator with PAS, ATPase and Fis domain
MADETLRDPIGLAAHPALSPGSPGVVLIATDARPCWVPLLVPVAGEVLGRERLLALGVDDARASRRHVAIERDGAALRVRDLGSTNGVFLRGVRVVGEARVEEAERAVLRLGRTLALVVPRLRPDEARHGEPLERDGVVAGPSLRAVHRQIAALGRAGEGLFLRGESGSGKEVAAHAYHDASPRRLGPFVAVNCAAVPRELAERLFFGAVRGAYSGSVADADGYLQAARGGTLFLDEVAELDPAVQAKLLRALEAREVLPLGGTRPVPLSLGLCAATLRDLRAAVAAGLFREDLYYRIGRPEVALPPLRERLEEVPSHVARTLAPLGLAPDLALIEECLLRPWPGNVRELCAELRAAAALARSQGDDTVRPQHLAPAAGQRLGPASAAAPAAAPAATPPVDAEAIAAAGRALGLARKTVLKLLSPAHLAAVAPSLSADDRATAFRAAAAGALGELLVAHHANHSAVAAALGVSRTTLLKLLDSLALRGPAPSTL